ncbi:MAG: sigma-70 family RNA polymerase sigma factor, partial [Bryobacteraceae bacterium]
MANSAKVARFEAAVMPHFTAAYNLARWLTRSAADADDVTQEAYLRAFTFFDGFRGGDARAWLLSIVRNTCYTWLRKNRGEYPLDEFDEALHATANPGAARFGAAGTEMIKEALERLPSEYREALVLREMEGFSYKEIAEITG